MNCCQVALCLGSCAILLFLVQTDATLMLGSMMLAAKTGLMLGKMGVGGMMMMLLAASQNYDGGTAYGKKRAVRSVGHDDKVATTQKLVSEEEITVTERMVRQIDSTFDSLTCIPKFVCGMNTQPTSKKTSIINDYGHLLKLMIADPDDEDSDEEGNSKSKGKQGMKFDSKEDEQFEDMVNDELMNEDPELLPFILQDFNKKRKTAMNVQNDDSSDDYASNPAIPPYYPPPPPPPPPRSPLSSLSSYLPKIEAGLGTKVTDSDFDSDPFFAGFRSLKAIFQNTTGREHKPVFILDMDDKDLTDVPKSKAERIMFVQRKAKELEMTTDTLKKYRIAAEVGRKLKSKEDCSKVFKKCPYKWEEVTGVVSNIRNAITGHPMITGKQPVQHDQVVYLKTGGSNESMLSIAHAGGGESTKVVHDLGNGTLMEISMKLVPMVPVDMLPSPAVENLGVNVKDLKKRNNTITYPVDTQFPIRHPPTLTDDPLSLDQTVLLLQNVNSKKPNKRPSLPKPIVTGKFPILKEEIATIPTPIGDDDEFDDIFPILVSTLKSNTKVTPAKVNKSPAKTKDDEVDDVEEDDEDDVDDDGDDDDDGDSDEDNEKEQGRMIPAESLARRMASFHRLPLPILLRQRNLQYFDSPEAESLDKPGFSVSDSADTKRIV